MIRARNWTVLIINTDLEAEAEAIRIPADMHVTQRPRIASVKDPYK